MFRINEREVRVILEREKQISERILWKPQPSKTWQKHIFKVKVWLIESDETLLDDNLQLNGTVNRPKTQSFDPLNEKGSYSFNLSYAKKEIRRLDTQVGHKNPDGTIAEVPHKHRWRKKTGMKETYNPTPLELVGNRNEVNDMCIGFLMECNINYIAYIPLSAHTYQPGLGGFV